MTKRNIDFKKIFILSDIVPILVILIGLFIAIFLHEIAIRLIGMSVAILGGVALFMLISQRISEFVEMKHTPKEPPQNFKITKKKSASATSTVFEDFNDSFGPEKAIIIEEKEAKKVDFMGSDEGFRILKKTEQKLSYTQNQAGVVTEKQENNISRNKTESPVTANISAYNHSTTLDNLQQSQTIGKSDENISNKNFQSENNLFNQRTDSRDVKLEISYITSSKPKLNSSVEKINQEKTETPDEQENIDKPDIQTVEKNYKETIFDSQIAFLTEDFPIAGNEPRKEFEYFLNRVLMTIRSVTNTRTSAFILINSEKKELILISFVTDVAECIVPRIKFPLGKDVVSQIVLSKKPEILTEINPAAELDLIPYYNKKVGTLSFIGVPVFYNNTVIGVLAADTNVLDAYDAVTVTFFGHFTKLISALVLSYTDKYDLLQASRTLDAISQFREFVNTPNKSINDIVDSLINSASELIEFTTIGVCGYDEMSGGWYNKVKKGKDSPSTTIKLESPVLADSSLIGESIINNKTLLISPLDEDVVRVHPNETKLENGFFVSVPIILKSISSTYGALYVEGKNAASLTSFDVNILETLCDHAGSNIEKLHFIDILQTSAMFDATTGMLNQPAFHHRLREEFLKSLEFNLPITLCLLRIDKYASYDPNKYQQRMEKVLYHVLNIIRRQLRQFDIFGRVDINSFGIILIGMKIENAKIWAERLRKEIAISVLEIDSKRFTVTVSVGIADNYGCVSHNNLLENAKKVLDKSLERTNTVTLFS